MLGCAKPSPKTHSTNAVASLQHTSSINSNVCVSIQDFNASRHLRTCLPVITSQFALPQLESLMLPFKSIAVYRVLQESYQCADALSLSHK